MELAAPVLERLRAEDPALEHLVREKLAEQRAAPGGLERDQLSNLLASMGLPPVKLPPSRSDAIAAHEFQPMESLRFIRCRSTLDVVSLCL